MADYRRLFASLILIAIPVLATADGDVVFGRELAESERCQQCHDQVAEHTPKHSGQLAHYLVKQLEDFQKGARRHPVMNKMAADLTDLDRRDIAAYYASLPAMQGPGVEPGGDTGRRLFVQGAPERGLPACRDCHGEKGQGQVHDGMAVPRLAGQQQGYLDRQLRHWRSGERDNSPGKVMNRIAERLSDAEIEALSAFLANYPLPDQR